MNTPTNYRSQSLFDAFQEVADGLLNGFSIIFLWHVPHLQCKVLWDDPRSTWKYVCLMTNKTAKLVAYTSLLVMIKGQPSFRALPALINSVKLSLTRVDSSASSKLVLLSSRKSKIVLIAMKGSFCPNRSRVGFLQDRQASFTSASSAGKSTCWHNQWFQQGSVELWSAQTCELGWKDVQDPNTDLHNNTRRCMY